jgi:RNA polymerase sigma factor (sigma-70 family)
MNVDLLDGVLERLCSGDAEAAEQVFLAYEPYLRLVIRRQLPGPLRAKFDSTDVVQSIWVDVLHGFREAGWQFTNANQLRAFLVKAARNRFIDRVRQHGRAVAAEQPLTETDQEALPVSSQPQPSEVLQAGELWEQLLTICPPAHHELLRLKRQGHSIGEIADRTGLHEGSVRRILYDLARRLGFQQQKLSSGKGSGPIDEG